jgi:hypothetical protein
MSFLNSSFTNFNENSFVLVLKDNEFSLEGKIYFDLRNKNYTEDILNPKIDDFYIVKETITNEETQTVKDFKQSIENTEFLITFNPTNKINFETQEIIKSNHELTEITDNSKFNYHGTGIYEKFTVHIFSFLKENFKKNLIFFVDNTSQAGGKSKRKNKSKSKNLKKSKVKSKLLFSKKNNKKSNKKK